MDTIGRLVQMGATCGKVDGVSMHSIGRGTRLGGRDFGGCDPNVLR